jgi:hypothetical protein
VNRVATASREPSPCSNASTARRRRPRELAMANVAWGEQAGYRLTPAASPCIGWRMRGANKALCVA